MRKILERKKEVKDKQTGRQREIFEEVKSKKEATHTHYCYHDENPPKPCKRIKKGKE